MTTLENNPETTNDINPTEDSAPIHIKTENWVFDDGIDWTGITDKNLIIAICSISNLVCIHKIVSKKKITHMINVYHKLNLSNEMIEKAIEICDKRAVITGVTPTHVYQTNSTSVRNLLDSYDILMEAQSSEVTDMFGDE